MVQQNEAATCSYAAVFSVLQLPDYGSCSHTWHRIDSTWRGHSNYDCHMACLYQSLCGLHQSYPKPNPWPLTYTALSVLYRRSVFTISMGISSQSWHTFSTQARPQTGPACLWYLIIKWLLSPLDAINLSSQDRPPPDTYSINNHSQQHKSKPTYIGRKLIEHIDKLFPTSWTALASQSPGSSSSDSWFHCKRYGCGALNSWVWTCA